MSKNAVVFSSTQTLLWHLHVEWGSLVKPCRPSGGGGEVSKVVLVHFEDARLWFRTSTPNHTSEEGRKSNVWIIQRGSEKRSIRAYFWVLRCRSDAVIFYLWPLSGPPLGAGSWVTESDLLAGGLWDKFSGRLLRNVFGFTPLDIRLPLPSKWDQSSD